MHVLEIKTVTENRDSKMPSVGTILDYLETTAYTIFPFSNKTFLLFKMKAEIFSICLKKNLCDL